MNPCQFISQPGVKLCSDDMTLHLVLLDPGVTSINNRGKELWGMKALAKLISRSLVLFIIPLLGLLSLPAIVTAGEEEAATRLEGQRLRQQEKDNMEYRKLLAKGYVQQARMRQWHGAVALAKRVAARDVKEKLRNERNVVVTERYNKMIHGSKIMREGMMRAEAMLTEGPNLLVK